jgi:hypothetical protein
MKRSGWLVPVLLVGLVTFAHAQSARTKVAQQTPVTKRGLPWLKIKVSAQPLKARLDHLGLKVSAPIQRVTPTPPPEAPATVTLGCQTTSAPGAYVFATSVEVWAGGALPVEGIVPSIWYQPQGEFFILYSLTGAQGKDLIFECSGAFSSSMDVEGYAITDTQEVGAVWLTVATTQNKTSVKVLIDPADLGNAPWLMFGLTDSGQNETWRLTTCTVEKK